MKGSNQRELKCNCCGAPLECEPGATIVRCVHCGMQFAVGELVGGDSLKRVREEVPPDKSRKGARVKRDGVPEEDDKFANVCVAVLIVVVSILVLGLIISLVLALTGYTKPPEGLEIDEPPPGEASAVSVTPLPPLHFSKSPRV